MIRLFILIPFRHFDFNLLPILCFNDIGLLEPQVNVKTPYLPGFEPASVMVLQSCKRTPNHWANLADKILGWRHPNDACSAFPLAFLIKKQILLVKYWVWTQYFHHLFLACHNFSLFLTRDVIQLLRCSPDKGHDWIYFRSFIHYFII